MSIKPDEASEEEDGSLLHLQQLKVSAIVNEEHLVLAREEAALNDEDSSRIATQMEQTLQEQLVSDDSAFLCHVNNCQCKRHIFPMGHYSKAYNYVIVSSFRTLWQLSIWTPVHARS